MVVEPAPFAKTKRGFRELHSRDNVIYDAEFFDAREAPVSGALHPRPRTREFFRDWFQVAVAFHHYFTKPGNTRWVVGAPEARAIKNLYQPAGSFGKIQLTPLLLLNHSANGARPFDHNTLPTDAAHRYHSMKPGRLGLETGVRIVFFPVTQSSTAKRRAAQSPAKKYDPIPLLDLHRQYRQIREEVLAALERVCASQQFVLGAEVEALEREVATFTGAGGAVGYASSGAALAGSLAAGVQRVRSSLHAFSFFASAGIAIVRAGSRPVLVDVNPETLNLDPELVNARLRAGGTYKIRALLPVHLYGQCADMDELQENR